MNATITARSAYCVRIASSVEDRDRAIVREDHAGDVADHDRRDLDVPDRGRRDEREVDDPVARTEEVPAEPERVGEAEQPELALQHEEREVVGDDVGQHDRDERVRERTASGCHRPSTTRAATRIASA